MAAFRRALALGVTTLELDTGVTRDGVVVVGHDERAQSRLHARRRREVDRPRPAPWSSH